ncbi:chromosome 10 open reading frame 35 [Plakobranchus ocellatus]|uniref:Chromosome 10 open reading frame 35 n=1 Tax=Plakobranchus ocellatus TaxID=259542 RepID=A0AAV4D275_9GAST|nr:chromosome 10 open reading frame 35 [Plakobranchus ocellatus]
MVRILANGDIVPDDDPRARASQPTQRPNTRTPQRQEQGGDYGQQGQSVSIFQVLNQRLLAFGIPRFNIGDIVVEPIVSVGLLLSLVLFGIHGLIFGAILFAVSHWSTNGAPDFVTNLFGGAQRGDGDGQRGNRPQHRAGGGYRLGR